MDEDHYRFLRNGFDAARFQKQLAEAITWCKPRLSLNELDACFRSRELKPGAEEEYWIYFYERFHNRPPSVKPEKSPETGFYTFTELPASEKQKAFDQLIRKRSDALAGHSLPDSEVSQLAGGALLVTMWGINESAMMMESVAECAVIGWDDTPAWDTWVYYSNDDLVSWVPPELVEQIHWAIRVNVLDCLNWVEGPALESLLSQIEQ